MNSGLKKATAWAITLAALLPFILSPHLFADEVGGKTVFIRGLAFLVTALLCYAAVFQKNMASRAALLEKIYHVGRNRLFQIFALSTVLLGVSAIFAYNQDFAFFGELSRAEGFLTIFAFFMVFFAMAVTFGKKEWDRYFFVTSLAGAATFFLTVGQTIKGGVRPDATVGNPIFLASYFVFMIAVGAYIYFEARKNAEYFLRHKSFFIFFGLFTAVSSLIGIFLTQTRGTLLAVAVAIVITFVFGVAKGNRRPMWKKTLRFWSALALLLLLALTTLFGLTRSAQFWQSVPGLNRIATSSVAGGTIASRTKLTELSLKGFFADKNAKTLLLGWGSDNYIYFFQKNYDPSIYQYEQSMADRSHNKLVDVLVMSGILGLIAYLAIWFFLFKYALSLMKKNLSVGLATMFFLSAYFINNLFAFDVAVSYLGFYSVAAYLIYERK